VPELQKLIRWRQYDAPREIERPIWPLARQF
jgi:hypothetical protein